MFLNAQLVRLLALLWLAGLATRLTILAIPPVIPLIRDELQMTEAQVTELESRYQLKMGEIEPKVYWRITDNWLELTVRFLSPDHGTREIKDAMSREIMAALDAAGIGIASATYEITGLPPVLMRQDSSRASQ